MKKIVLTTLFIISCHFSFSQMAVTNPTQEFQETLRWIDTQVKWAEEKAHSAQVIQQMTETLQKAKEIKESTERVYSLSQKVYDEGKRLGALVDAGFPGLIYGLQVVVGEPLNPAYYIPRVGKKSEELRKILEYEPGSQINADARMLYKDFLQYDENSGDSAVTRFTKAGYELINAVNGFSKFKKDKELDNTMAKLQQSRLLDSLANVMYNNITKDGHLGMNDADRIAMLLKVLELREKSKLLELEALKEMEAEMREKTDNPEFQKRCIQKAINWKINNEFFKTGKKYSSSGVKFSLADWEKSHPEGFKKDN